MKILFFTSSIEDYLADTILHGLRMIYGKEAVDYPKCDIIYKNCPEEGLKHVRGNGFTLYTGLLDDIDVNRVHIDQKIKEYYFDLIIFGDIQRQYGLFLQYRPWLKFNNTVMLDGYDTTQPYPARGFWWRKPYYWFLLPAHSKFLYFKREWTPYTHFTIWRRLLPGPLRALLPQHKNVRRISYSMPIEKIITKMPVKIKDFPKHIVDPDVAERLDGSLIQYAFTSEEEYYRDLQESRFGITTKRAGWDCLRHYEIAGNGTVLCFRDLDKKPVTCAPHGLVDGVNCISYTSFDDLQQKIKALNDEQYNELQANTMKWVRDASTINRAMQLINEHRLSCKLSVAELATPEYEYGVLNSK